MMDILVLIQEDDASNDFAYNYTNRLPKYLGNDLECLLKTGDYVILSIDPGCLLVGRGVIMDIIRTNVTRVCFFIHDLCQEVWRIDKDESTRMRFSLIQMFLATR